MQPLTADQIRASFVNASGDEIERMPLPGLHEVIWDQREYLGWRDPQTRLGYLVHWADGRPVGIVLRAAAGSLRPGIQAMCSFCHSPQPATQVRMFSAPRAGESGRNGNTIGAYVCEDLGCSHLIRIAPPHASAPEAIAARGAALLARVSNFTAEVRSTISD
ncbi:FBP domain-containing protein [Gryllotalpicola sp.]|uniref:FBP domain-containing protein n=1 Tax=Gryllotalpicola sp. TaxID=1932787 RepID=UPI00262813C1|nr:FBP domain-containing protein [Gryllotalpicola sp.]